MSDFLSKFNKGNYDQEQKELQKRRENRQEQQPAHTEAQSKEQLVESQSEEQIEAASSGAPTGERSNAQTPAQQIRERSKASPEPNDSPYIIPNNRARKSTDEPEPMSRRRKEEETEFDPTYKGKQKRKRLLIAGLIGLGCIVGFVLYYQTTHVKVPDFTNKDVADARSWASENGMKVELEQKYEPNVAANKVVEQKQKAKSTVKKGSTLNVTASLGADPEEQLQLPDFMTMSKKDAEDWITAQQADNISIIEEFHETEEAGKALKMEFTNAEVNKDNYHRKDKLKLYYSKGKETYNKNITVPDFAKKTKTEVETWAKNNEIEVIFEEVTSADAEAGTIISQGIAKDEKLAKKDQLPITVSLGKGIVVPDFSEYSMDEAPNAVSGLNIQVKTIFTENMGYGQLVSQSEAAGTELTSKDDQTVKVVYSAGQPYMKDLRGTTVEGDLQKLFYDEFQSKGANINYQIRYVDSAEAKGMVVDMNVHGQYLPLNYTVYLDISLGNLSGEQKYGTPQNQESGTDGTESE
ncbi:PASTA domain-containing protein [uncultured Enterococcus sp.]|uniref:PASTA domain-containing protein n=1 Tax=uncultured Enterococcus sp. TaxID=167972 RepID=UPI002AA85133|nr:PASTA domain-containing protein [uncultured Enterococcus sp.]